MKIDLPLLKRFDVPVPRYTSYPTALNLTATTAQDVVAFEKSHPANSDVSLYFHLPFCASLCWYCACTKVITDDKTKSRPYLDRIRVELDLKRDLIEGRELVQLHLGGGTPTFFTPEELHELGDMTRELVNWAPDAEIGIEIDPRTVTPEHIGTLRTAGFNRASLGVQDHDPEVQKAIHRIQPLEQTQAVVDALREHEFQSINMDLIYGLPLQTADSMTRTINDVLSMRPDRLAVYSYAHVPWAAPAQKILEKRHGLPSADEKLGLFLKAASMLMDAGYVHIGMDHFALPEDPLSVALKAGTLRRNFQGYSTYAGVDIHGFGMSSISQTHLQYFQNMRDLGDWERALDHGQLPINKAVILSPEDVMRREIIMSIMCSAHLDLATICQTHQIDVDYFSPELTALKEFEDLGLVELSTNEVKVTEVGRFFVRNIAGVFDAYRQSQTGFSKAI